MSERRTSPTGTLGGLTFRDEPVLEPGPAWSRKGSRGLTLRRGGAEAEEQKASRYDAIFERVLSTVADHEAALARERAEAPALVDQLTGHPPGRRKLLVRNSRRFASWVLCQHLIEASHEQGFKDPAVSLELAELAAEVAERLDRSRYGAGPAEDIKAAAWAQVGNARRILSDLRKSDEAFSIAEFCLARGTGDPLERARVQDLRASLRRAQRRFEESLQLLDRAISSYREVGDRRLECRATIKKSAVLALAGDLDRGIEVLRRALTMIDAEEEPRLAFYAHHNLLALLTDSGRYLEAQACLPRVRRLLAISGDELLRLRLRWVEGMIACGLGQLRKGERALKEARHGFLAKGIAYDAAMVSLDLAAAYTREGRNEEIEELSRQMLPIFRSRELHRETIAALLLFQRAVESSSLTLGLVQEIATFLRQSRENPKLRFVGSTTR